MKTYTLENGGSQVIGIGFGDFNTIYAPTLFEIRSKDFTIFGFDIALSHFEIAICVLGFRISIHRGEGDSCA